MTTVDTPLSRTTLGVATILVGLSAGFFVTYEASVTLGLAEVDDVTYVRTFQAINATIRNPTFGLFFFGPILATPAALALGWRGGSPRRRALLVAAPILYAVGVAVTFAGNVPLNETLALVDGTDPLAAAEARADFEDEWNRLNMIRTIAVSAGFVALVGARLAVGDHRPGAEQG